MTTKRISTLNKKGRVFNEEWEVQYFLVPNNDKMRCVICDAIISCMK